MHFVAVEDVTTGKQDGSLQVVDIPPLAGTLILFDSVVVPHEVLPVAVGNTPSLYTIFLHFR